MVYDEEVNGQRHIGSNAKRKLILKKGFALIIEFPPFPFMTIYMIDDLENDNDNSSEGKPLYMTLSQKQ